MREYRLDWSRSGYRCGLQQAQTRGRRPFHGRSSNVRRILQFESTLRR